jgi:hypothetical protein
MLKEFHIDTAYESEQEMWILGRTGEATSLSVGDTFTHAAYYIQKTKFEEYILPYKMKSNKAISSQILEIESYNKKLAHVGENTVVLLRITWDGSVKELQSDFNVLS